MSSNFKGNNLRSDDVRFRTSSSTSEISSSSTSKLSSLSTLYGSDDEDFSSPSAEVVTCAPVPTKDEFEMETEEETEEEKEEETDDDKDDETWTPKPIGTSSSTPSTKKTSVNRGEPVRHCIIGLVSPKTYELISKKEFGVRKEVNESKEQVNKGKERVNESKELVNKGKRKMYD
ncbi:hypothetical protein Tco_1092000 [Tanacetum coccineum]|uniref:Uncharacterized protein n=1 Tax=Tanacetum coccineum TaxID=301880 RepID=A0ABQ5I8M1_9ASTR